MPIENWKPLTYSGGREDGGYGNGFNGGYSEIVESWGYAIAAKARLGDYQGDHLYLLRDNDQYGLLTVGYGSCSGCDALEGCDTHEEVENLRASMHSSIQWKSADETRDYLLTLDCAAKFYGEDTDALAFVNQSLSLIGPPAFTETINLLLRADDVDLGVLADAFQDADMDTIATSLRNPHTATQTHSRLIEAARRAGATRMPTEGPPA